MTDSRRTEQVHPDFTELDTLEALELVRAFAEDQLGAVRAVQQAAPALAAATQAAVTHLQRGGRLIYVGAGTSGRLGVLDATELTPTFSWPAERAVALIAGGEQAIRQAVEGAEDDAGAGQADVQAVKIGPNDVLIGIAASGTTPYVLGALRAGQAAGALTIALANNPGAPLLKAAKHGILLDTGPEIISGSTRLKAGTAQKMALNTLSSAIMVRLGKVYSNLMVDVMVTNKKLKERAVRLVQYAAQTDETTAAQTLALAQGNVKRAIIMLKLGVSESEAMRLLHLAAGHTRQALEHGAQEAHQKSAGERATL